MDNRKMSPFRANMSKLFHVHFNSFVYFGETLHSARLPTHDTFL